MRSAILASLLIVLGAACGPAADTTAPGPVPLRAAPLPSQPVGATLRGRPLSSGTSTQALQTAAAGTMALGPNLGFSTYLFSGAARKVATDAAGNSYVVGELEYVVGPVFVAKLTPAGVMTWAYAYAGDNARGIAVDGAGNIFVLVKQTSAGQSVLAKLDPSGAFATAAVALPLGMNALALDAAGNAYVTGTNDVPGGTSDVLVYKLTPSLSLVYGRLFGGSNDDSGLEIAADGSGNAYVQGRTFSSDLPGAQNSFSGGLDVFLAKIDPAGSSLLFTRYFGNSYYDFGGGLAVDGSGSIYMAWTSFVQYGGVPALFPGSVQAPVGGGQDVTVAKLSPSGATIFSGRYGGSSDEYVYAVAVDASGAVAVAGYTWSADFPVTGNAAFGSYRGGSDTYVLQLNPSGSAISYASYLGGSGPEQITAMAFDGSKSAIVVGDTWSSDFPVTNGSVLPSAEMSNFATKFLQSSDTVAPTCAITSPTGGNVSGTVALSASASDNVGLAKVELYVDGVLRGTDLYAPYTGSWDTTGAAVGSHSLSCKAYDAAGNVGTSAPVTVTVPDTIPPVVYISDPADGSTVSGTVTVQVFANDNVRVTKVELYAGSVLVGSSTALGPVFTFYWSTAGWTNSAYWLTAKAYDAAGNVATSAIVTVTVNNTICTLAWSKNPVPSGSSATLTLTASGAPIPSGSRSYLYGTKDGVTDFNGYDWGLPPYSQGFLNTFSNAGTYRRWVTILGPDGTTVCTSNVATTVFQAPTCTAAFSKSVVAQGDSVVFSLTSTGNIPAGSISYLYGTKNGVTDEPGNAFSGPNFSYTITNTPGLAGSYVRWLVVKTSGGQKVCQSNQTSTTFQ